MKASAEVGPAWSRSLSHVAARVMRRVEPEDNPSAVVYGTIAVGLLLAEENPAAETYARVAESSAAAMVRSDAVSAAGARRDGPRSAEIP